MGRHLIIRGKVQGVGYRAAFERQARALQLRGWVRNRDDGSVEAQVFGDADAIEQITAWAGHGPSQAVVTLVEKGELADETSCPADFSVLPTA
ncbi:MAG TPA: acylphosphatase [Noviherbaspirillum sp.]